MKSILISPWTLFILLLAVVFGVWSTTLIISVNQHQQEVNSHVELMTKLNELEQSIQQLGTWITENGQETTVDALENQWRQLYSNYRAQAEAFDGNNKAVRNLGDVLNRTDFSVVRMDSLHARILASGSGQAERERLEAEFRREMNRVVAEVEGTLRTIRGHLTGMSLDLAGRWGSLKGLTLTAIIMAIFVVALLFTLKRTYVMLRESNKRLAVTLRSIGDGVITTDMQGRIVLINKVAETLTGWTEEEASGFPVGEVYHIINEKTRERCENPMEKVLKTGAVIGLANHTVLIARDGTERIVADSGAPIRDKDGQMIGVVLVFHDITEKRKIEAERLKASKLESIGILAGGIAHDFNNILTSILGNVSLAKLGINSEGETFEILAEAEKASLQARDLTQQLLTFSKGGVPIKETASIRELIKDSTSFALRGSNVRCDFSFPDDLWPVEVDEGQISQVIQNLMINANQAMPEGGIIHVRAENMIVGSDQGLPLGDGNYVRIAIEDQGVGIPEQILPKIFDPYFTTKQKGSGLGLASTYAIITKHDGHITVESEMGVGTTFTIYLPASEKEIMPKKEVRGRPVAGEGKILIVDDEELIRRVTGDVLTRFGYEVESVRDGAEAIELYAKARESGQPFDAVILDLTVPGGMGGKETIKRLREIDPQVKALVSSGYSDDPVMAEFGQYGFSGCVAKPYKIQELSQTLHTVISGSQVRDSV